MEAKEAENIRHRGDRRDKEKEMGWDVRLLATKTEQVLAELLISRCKGKKNEKSKMLLQWIKQRILQKKTLTEFVLQDIPHDIHAFN